VVKIILTVHYFQLILEDWTVQLKLWL